MDKFLDMVRDMFAAFDDFIHLGAATLPYPSDHLINILN